MSTVQPPPPTGPPIDGPVDLFKAPPPAAVVRQPAEGAARWRPWIAWVGWVSGFGVTIVVGIVVGVIAVAASGAPFSRDFEPSAGLNIGLTMFQNAAFLAAAFLFARIGGGRPIGADFGLVKPHLGKAVGILMAVWACFFALSAAWAEALRLKPSDQDLPERLGAGDSLSGTLLVVFLVTIVAPLGEELFFRGFFFRALRNWRGVMPAAILTGLVFGAMHIGSAPPGFLVPLVVFGVALCLLYHWTGSLYPCIALHALNNSLALGVALDWTWEIPATMAGSVAVTVTIAWGVGRLLGRRERPVGPLAVAV